MIRLFSTHIPPGTAEKVADLIRSGWINRGAKAAELEEAFAKKFGYKYALSVNSCTSALRLAYTIAGGAPGGEVITTPYTMVATNTALLEAGFKTVFADIKYGTANIDPADISHRINDRTEGIAVVHYGGYPCDMDEIYKVAGENGLWVVEDAAQALGAKYRGRPVGDKSFSCFSFQAIKHITTADGGMFVTNWKQLYDEAKERIWFGVDKDKRVDSPLGKFPEDITRLGFKYGMNDVAAVMGLEGLKVFDAAFTRRRKIAWCYREELEDVEGLTLMEQQRFKKSANWLFPIHIEKRTAFAKAMRAEGIEVAVHNWRNDQYTLFGGKQDLPNTDRVNDDIIHIPLHAELTDEEVNRVVSTIKDLNWLR